MYFVLIDKNTQNLYWLKAESIWIVIDDNTRYLYWDSYYENGHISKMQFPFDLEIAFMTVNGLEVDKFLLSHQEAGFHTEDLLNTLTLVSCETTEADAAAVETTSKNNDITSSQEEA